MRFIRTFKDNLYRRLDGLGQNQNEWVKHVSGIITKYNNTVHSTIEIKPVEAKLPQNHLWVAWHLQSKSKNNRPYEEIEKGDVVRIMIKTNKFDKAHMPNWSSEKYKVIGIDNNNVILNHPTKQELFYVTKLDRHEFSI